MVSHSGLGFGGMVGGSDRLPPLSDHLCSTVDRQEVLPHAFSTSQVSDVMLPCARCDLLSHYFIQVGCLKALCCMHTSRSMFIFH